MPVTRNGMVLASLKQGTSQIAFVFQGTVQIWAHEVVFVLGASGAAAYLVDIVNARPGVWGTSTPKRIVVPAGVERGSGTSWVFAPMAAGSPIASSWGGSLTLEIRGTLSGIGGTANSGVGGNVIVGMVGKDGQKLIVNVFAGAILRAGGGGGGRAGNGGGGLYYSTADSGWQWANSPLTTWNRIGGDAGHIAIAWFGSIIVDGLTPGYLTSYYSGGYTYHKGSVVGDNGQTQYNQVRRTWDVPNYTAGGVAGSAGRGQGFDGPALAGAPAVGGGINAGASGKSGDGGAYGSPGTTGTNGSNGNYSAGLAGAAPGLAGFYLTGAANVNFTNHGGALLGRLAA